MPHPTITLHVAGEDLIAHRHADDSFWQLGISRWGRLASLPPMESEPDPKPAPRTTIDRDVVLKAVRDLLTMKNPAVLWRTKAASVIARRLVANEGVYASNAEVSHHLLELIAEGAIVEEPSLNRYKQMGRILVLGETE